jgi:hypothetical protein
MRRKKRRGKRRRRRIIIMIMIMIIIKYQYTRYDGVYADGNDDGNNYNNGECD